MDVTERILEEYRDLPGLKLRTCQAARIWGLDLGQCERLLNQLVTDGHLFVDGTGQYRWTGCIRRTPLSCASPAAPKAVA